MSDLPKRKKKRNKPATRFELSSDMALSNLDAPSHENAQADENVQANENASSDETAADLSRPPEVSSPPAPRRKKDGRKKDKLPKLLRLAREKFAARNYAGTVHFLSQIPERDRTAEAKRLLAKATRASEEVEDLVVAIPVSLEAKNWALLESQLQRYLELKGETPRVTQLLQQVEKARESEAKTRSARIRNRIQLAKTPSLETPVHATQRTDENQLDEIERGLSLIEEDDEPEIVEPEVVELEIVEPEIVEPVVVELVDTELALSDIPDAIVCSESEPDPLH